MNSEQLNNALKTPLSLAGKKVLITGAGGGIGGATARICHEMGAKLVLVDLATQERLGKDLPVGADVEVFRCDTSKRSEVESLAKKVGVVDCVVDTVGVYPSEGWEDPDWDSSFDLAMNINLRAPINIALAFLPGMRTAGGGRVVLCGSLAGWIGGIRAGPQYAAAKGGVHAFVRWLALRGVKDNILVNAVAPGTTDTPMTKGQGFDPKSFPLQRLGRPEEIGGVLAFLCSPAAGFMTGAIVDVNGGTYFH